MIIVQVAGESKITGNHIKQTKNMVLQVIVTIIIQKYVILNKIIT